MEILVGSTGFVGSNLMLSQNFNAAFHSTDIDFAYGLCPDLLVYAGVTGTKFLANHQPEKDRQVIADAMKHIQRIRPRKLVLISTIDVYPNHGYGYEDDKPLEDALTVYGKNRLALEQWVENNVKDYHIIRLPGIYGANLKKNFIYDLCHPNPPMVQKADFERLFPPNDTVRECYQEWEDGYYHILDSLPCDKIRLLEQAFQNRGYTARRFTDSRGIYQYYHLKNLCAHIGIMLENHISKLNIATYPLSAAVICREAAGEDFYNEISDDPASYQMKTRYAALFQREGPYLSDRRETLEEIASFLRSTKSNCGRSQDG